MIPRTGAAMLITPIEAATTSQRMSRFSNTMAFTALGLQYWLDHNNIVASGQYYVIDNDTAIRIFYIHGNRAVELLRELGPWESDYAAHFAAAIASQNTLFMFACDGDVVH